MDRARRLTQFWNWLPAFRTVAETQHLPTAAKRLGVSASALSRTIKLLENELNVPLFRRVGRRIELSDAGDDFLTSVRNAMRLVHEGLLVLEPEELSGRLRFASRSTHAWLINPTVARIGRAHPGITPVLRTLTDLEMGVAIRRGEMDVGVADRLLAHRDLKVQKLGKMTYGVYAGPGHPLLERGVVTIEDLSAHPFVGPPEGVDDEWPPEYPRRIGARVDLLFTGMAAVASGVYLALLPDPATRGYHHLSRLPVDIGVTTDIFLVYRRPVGVHALTRVAVDNIVEVAGERL